MTETTTPTALRYVGPTMADVGVVPLPEGWPAADHDEPDAAAAAAKLAFRLARPGDEKGSPTGPVAYELKEASDGDRD